MEYDGACGFSLPIIFFQVSIVYGFLGYAIYLFISYFFFYKPIQMRDVVFYLGMIIALFIAVKLTA
ncbi:hypothetical protein [Guptibacillus hwajinpoensis]|uniref:hypothetical protein n=1 Tax=Guptibacillus hwajinpoensis TaxID=208199 RepID=UPI00273D01B5|nr:hypothetical protein [Pseudalkalibacillus hwajinpoensis]WLR59166.1 hypothetical protein LC071_18770 [Pseudalkalibacillus hwajinpoensis]